MGTASEWGQPFPVWMNSACRLQTLRAYVIEYTSFKGNSGRIQDCTGHTIFSIWWEKTVDGMTRHTFSIFIIGTAAAFRLDSIAAKWQQLAKSHPRPSALCRSQFYILGGGQWGFQAKMARPQKLLALLIWNTLRKHSMIIHDPWCNSKGRATIPNYMDSYQPCQSNNIAGTLPKNLWISRKYRCWSHQPRHP